MDWAQEKMLNNYFFKISMFSLNIAWTREKTICVYYLLYGQFWKSVNKNT